MHLKCGVSVSKRNDSECAWVEEAEFKDVSDKTFGDFFIAPHLSNTAAILSNPRKETPQIKRELDCNLSNTENEAQYLSVPYSEKENLNSLQEHENTFDDQRVPSNKDNISNDETSRVNINDENEKNGLKPSTSNINLEEDDVLENLRVREETNFEDQGDPVLVRPIPAELQEENHKQRRNSFDGKNIYNK